MTQLLTQDEAARQLRISRTSLWKLRQQKRIKAVLILGKVMFTQEDIDKFIEESTYPRRVARI